MAEWRKWFDSRLEDAIEAAADAKGLERELCKPPNGLGFIRFVNVNFKKLAQCALDT